MADALEAGGNGLAAAADEDPKWFYQNFLKPLLPQHQQPAAEPVRPLVILGVRRGATPGGEK